MYDSPCLQRVLEAGGKEEGVVLEDGKEEEGVGGHGEEEGHEEEDMPDAHSAGCSLVVPMSMLE